MSKLTIKTLSPLAAATGEGSTLIDSDVAFDKYGLPYIPARRIKSLLRESALEVLEMQGVLKLDKEIEDELNRLFGKVGAHWHEPGATFKINNCTLKDDKDISKFIIEKSIDAWDVSKTYTEQVDQTSIDASTGTAKDYSLRRYRLIKKNLEFETDIVHEVGNSDLLENACKNLRRMGSRRNRGFGNIVVVLSVSENDNGNKNKNEVCTLLSDNKDFASLAFTITTEAPITLGAQNGDQNTVSTEDFFGGNIIRGIVAKAFTDKNSDIFKQIFNTNQVQFGSAYLTKAGESFFPIPFNLHKKKGEENNNNLINIFNIQGELTRAVRGYGSVVENKLKKYSVLKENNFHHNRKNERVAGRSMDGGIFNYEAISEGQTFSGKICGEQNLLEVIAKLKITSATAGRSQSAQYGRLKIDFSPIPIHIPAIKNSVKEFYLHCISPLILFNDCGIAQPTVEALINYLKQALKIEKDETNNPLIQSATSLTQVQGFSAVWKSRTQRMAAFAPGSCFKITLSEATDIEPLFNKGFGERTNEGYGQVKIIMEGDMSTEIIPDNTEVAMPPVENLGEVGPDKTEQKKLWDLWDMRTKDIFNLTTKTEAITNAEKSKIISKIISNSLCSRIVELLNKSKTADAFAIELNGFENNKKGMKDKAANRSLTKAHLWDKLQNDFVNEPKSLEFEKNKLYWITFFTYLRKRKKTENEK